MSTRKRGRSSFSSLLPDCFVRAQRGDSYDTSRDFAATVQSDFRLPESFDVHSSLDGLRLVIRGAHGHRV